MSNNLGLEQLPFRDLDFIFCLSFSQPDSTMCDAYLMIFLSKPDSVAKYVQSLSPRVFLLASSLDEHFWDPFW